MFIFGFSGAWQADDDFQVLCDDVFASNRAAGLLDSEFAAVLDVPHSAVADMKAGRSPGPAFGRYARLPILWWAAFVTRRAVRYGLRIIEDARIDKLITRADRWLRMHAISDDIDKGDVA